MSKIEKVRITGFWGNRDFEIALNPDVTFLIGVNGSGKTTLINLIAASLTADFPTLDRLSFDTIEIIIKPDTGQKRPSIKVSKKKDRKLPFESISYEVRPSQAEQPDVFSLDDIENQRRFLGREMPPRFIRERYSRYTSSLQERLNEYVRVSWLSIHRVTSPQRPHEEKSFESTIDQKLSQVSVDFVKYLSSLSKQKDEQMARFQEFIFASLLDQMTEKELLSSAGKLDIADQKRVLIDVFKELHITDKKIHTEKINKFFSTTETINRKIESREVSLSELLNLFGQVRINRVIERWKQFRIEEEKIFSLLNRFIEIINKMIQKKQMIIDDNSEITFDTQSGKKLSLFELSSGEKQLLILLGEALLLRNEPCIYIADEPELSLHVSWQEKIVSSVTQLNDRAQLIVATHSPDVVGRLHNRAIEMEKILR